MAKNKNLNNILHSFIKDVKFGRRMQFVYRWQGVPQNLDKYSILLHGASCAIIYIALCTQLEVEPEANMITTLLLHDGMEVFTGDMLYPSKALVPEQWAEIERTVYNAHKDDTPLLLTDNDIEDRVLTCSGYVLFKIIDMFEFFLRALEEYNSGNRDALVIEGLNNATNVLIDLRNKTIESYEDTEFVYKSAELIYAVVKQECRAQQWRKNEY